VEGGRGTDHIDQSRSVRGGESARQGPGPPVGTQGYSQLAGMMSVDSNVDSNVNSNVDSNVDSNVRGGRGRDRAAIARACVWRGKRGRCWVMGDDSFRRYCRVRFHVERVTWRGDGVERVVVARRCALLCGRGGKHLLLETTAVPLAVGPRRGEGGSVAGRVYGRVYGRNEDFQFPAGSIRAQWGEHGDAQGRGKSYLALFTECVRRRT
jgi:hypothetical protein